MSHAAQMIRPMCRDKEVSGETNPKNENAVHYGLRFFYEQSMRNTGMILIISNNYLRVKYRITQPRRRRMKRLDTPQKKWGCGTIAVAILMICGAIYLFPRIFGGGDNAQPDDNSDTSNEVAESQSSSADVDLGDLEISEEIDRDGCAVNDVSSLDNVERFYIIAPNSEVPEGTRIFARLYRGTDIVEDLAEITANQDYNSTCINFAFESTNGEFEEGDYEVEFFVNGNAYSSINFSID
jgi:hypothetical protein